MTRNIPVAQDMLLSKFAAQWIFSAKSRFSNCILPLVKNELYVVYTDLWNNYFGKIICYLQF